MPEIQNEVPGISNSGFDILVSIPWGEGPDKVQPRLLDYPNFSLVAPEQMRKVYAPLRVRLDGKNGIHLLNDDNRDVEDEYRLYVTHFGPDGTLRGRTPLPGSRPETENRRIVDFAVDEDSNSYVLESFKEGDVFHNRLFKLNEDGDVVWEVKGLRTQDTCDFAKLTGEFTKLLIDSQSRLYLTCGTNPHLLARIEDDTGAVLETYSTSQIGDKAFMDGHGRVIGVAYFPEENRRGLSSFDPSSGEERITMGSGETYGLLLYPFGVDDDMNIYVYRLPRQEETSAIVKISFEGEVVHTEPLKDALVRPEDNTIFTHYYQNETVEISAYDQDGERRQWSFSLPEAYRSGRPESQKLIRADHRNRFYIFTGEGPGVPGKLLILSEDGNLEEETASSSDLLSLESTLQHFSHWQVDGEGRVYLPITGPDGFKIVRWNMNG